VRLLVYMRDGRTVYLLEKRGRLAQLVGSEPWNEGDSVNAVRGIWNHETGAYEWKAIHVRFIAKASISVVEEARGLSDAVKKELMAA
jgi:hypothetical protein